MVVLPSIVAVVCLFLASPAHAADIVFSQVTSCPSVNTYQNGEQQCGQFLDALGLGSLNVVGAPGPLVFTGVGGTDATMTAITLYNTTTNNAGFTGTTDFSGPLSLLG